MPKPTSIQQISNDTETFKPLSLISHFQLLLIATNQIKYEFYYN